MIAENLPILKIHKLTQAQYERELAAGRIDENALYLTPEEEIDLSNYATQSFVMDKIAEVKLDSVGIASVVQTTTSIADDGNNIITVTLTDGTSSTFTVQNGSKGSAGTNGKDGAAGKDGADGKTPVRGTDYWTAADIAEIKSYVDDAILGGAW